MSVLFCFAFMHVCLLMPCGHLLGLLALVCDVKLWCCHFPISILGQVWGLIVSIPDLCPLSYLNQFETSKTLRRHYNSRPWSSYEHPRLNYFTPSSLTTLFADIFISYDSLLKPILMLFFHRSLVSLSWSPEMQDRKLYIAHFQRCHRQFMHKYAYSNCRPRKSM